MIINLHGLGSTGKNLAFNKMYVEFSDDIFIASPSYTVHNFTEGLRELERMFSGFDYSPLVFVASSTGALFAEYLANKYNGQLVLINPVTDPEQIRKFIGVNKNHKTGEEYNFTETDFNSFKKAGAKFNKDIPRLVMFEKDDPVIDHNLTLAKYKGNAVVESFDGDSHVFSFWDEALPKIKDFYNRIYM